MKIRSFIFCTVVALTTFVFGLAGVGVFNFVFTAFGQSTPHMVSPETVSAVEFDINDPESVLPLDHEADKLTSPKTDETNEAEFDPEGTYFLLEEPTAAFIDFENFTINNKNLEVRPEQSNYGVLVSPSGFVQTDRKFEFRHISIGGGEINFTTEPQNGISYEFTGKFLVRGNFYTLEEDAEVVEGLLIKKENGMKIAEDRVSFGWFITLSCVYDC